MPERSDLGRRVLTAVLGIPIVLGLVMLGEMGTWLMALLLSIFTTLEFASLTLRLPDSRQKKGLLFAVSALAFAAYWGRAQDSWIGFAVLILFTYYLVTSRRYLNSDASVAREHFVELMASCFSVLYLVVLPLCLPRLSRLPLGMHWVLFYFLLVWSVDIAGYFVGRRMGKHRLFEAVSPKKSVEGAVAGTFAAMVVGGVYGLFLMPSISWIALLGVSFGASVACQVGDLCESLIKRVYGTKDSGVILPGHGGVLDRFDGFIFGLPVIYGCARWLMA